MVADEAQELLVLPFEQWPERDRTPLLLGLTPSCPFDDDQNYASTLRPDTLLMVRKANGRWLGFLQSRGWLDPQEAPLARVTVPRLRAYFRELVRRGNMSSTIIGRFSGLVLAMKIFAPGKKVGWIANFDGATVRSRLPRQRRTLKVPPAEELLDWGLTLMDTWHTINRVRERLVQYRDGLLIVMLAMRARRRRSMSLITTTREIYKAGDIYRIELAADQVKTDREDSFPFDAMLTPYIDRYMAEIRPSLLRERPHDAFWVGINGRPLSAKGISTRIEVLSKKRFGYTFGPHRARHSACMLLVEAEPANPGLAAAALGISKEIVDKHYDRSNQRRALTNFAAVIDRKRAALLATPRRRG